MGRSTHGVGGWLPRLAARRFGHHGVNVEAEPSAIAVIQCTDQQGSGPRRRSVRLGFNTGNALMVDFGVPDPATLIRELTDAHAWAESEDA